MKTLRYSITINTPERTIFFPSKRDCEVVMAKYLNTREHNVLRSLLRLQQSKALMTSKQFGDLSIYMKSDSELLQGWCIEDEVNPAGTTYSHNLHTASKILNTTPTDLIDNFIERGRNFVLNNKRVALT